MVEIEKIQPTGLVDVRGFGFSQVVRATGGSQIFISGQVSCDESGIPVGVGDIEQQTHQVMKNISAALESASATFKNVVKLTIYIVDYEPSVRAKVAAVRYEYIDPHDAPASTLIGVQALAAPEFLIEIEAIAVT